MDTWTETFYHYDCQINNSQGYVWKPMEGEKLECVLRIVAVIKEEGSDALEGS